MVQGFFGKGKNENLVLETMFSWELFPLTSVVTFGTIFCYSTLLYSFGYLTLYFGKCIEEILCCLP